MFINYFLYKELFSYIWCMEAALIRIDRNTIKRNPNAGSTQTLIPGNATFKFTFDVPFYETEIDFDNLNNTKGLPYDEFKLGVNCNLVSVSVDNDIATLVIAATSNELPDLVSNGFRPKGVSLSMDRNVTVCDHSPEPDYFYEYEPAMIECMHCGHEFNHNELSSDSFLVGDDFDEIFVQDICPNCNAGDCCEYEYEKIEDVLAMH